MAIDKVTTSKTLDITIIDDQMNEFTFKLNGGAVEGTSLSGIRAVYQPMITSGYLYSSKGYPITAVAKAVSVVTVTTKTEME